MRRVKQEEEGGGGWRRKRRRRKLIHLKHTRTLSLYTVKMYEGLKYLNSAKKSTCSFSHVHWTNNLEHLISLLYTEE